VYQWSYRYFRKALPVFSICRAEEGGDAVVWLTDDNKNSCCKQRVSVGFKQSLGTL